MKISNPMKMKKAKTQEKSRNKLNTKKEERPFKTTGTREDFLKEKIRKSITFQSNHSMKRFSINKRLAMMTTKTKRKVRNIPKMKIKTEEHESTNSNIISQSADSSNNSS
mmetsp:Transcript_13037/g.14669  ORF Transcript_13037/g.14669 Transcript_13037/m.14669 type:complete len:110 (-) Transcript_13037:29-358(-)